jgi:hypothetical protein
MLTQKAQYGGAIHLPEAGESVAQRDDVRMVLIDDSGCVVQGAIE